MAVLVKHGGKYYEIPDDVLSKSVITKEEFDRKVRRLEVELTAKGEAGLAQYEFLDLSDAEDK